VCTYSDEPEMAKSEKQCRGGYDDYLEYVELQDIKQQFPGIAEP